MQTVGGTDGLEVVQIVWRWCRWLRGGAEGLEVLQMGSVELLYHLYITRRNRQNEYIILYGDHFSRIPLYTYRYLFKQTLGYAVWYRVSLKTPCFPKLKNIPNLHNSDDRDRKIIENIDF